MALIGEVTGSGGLTVTGSLVVSGAIYLGQHTASTLTVADLGSGAGAAGGLIYVKGSKLYFVGQDADAETALGGLASANTWTATQTFSEVTGTSGFLVADDKKIYFGTDKDASIEYDEDGTDKLIITGAPVTVAADLTASQGLSTTVVSASSNVEIGGTLSVDNTADFDTRVNVSGAFEVAATGRSTFFGQLTASNGVSITGDVSASSDFSIGGGLAVDKDVDIDGRLIVSGTAIFGSVAAAGADTDKFLVLGVDATGLNTLQYRAGSDVASDIGAVASDANTSFTGKLTASNGLLIPDDVFLAFGSGQDATIEYDEDGTDELRFAGAAVTFEQAVTFDGDVTLGADANDTTTVTGELTASLGMSIPDDKKLYFGTGFDWSVEYDEDGADALQMAGTTFTMTTDTATFISANSTDPLVIIKNTTNDTNGARLRFVKDKGAAGADSDVVGLIEFVGDDDAQAQTLFAEIKAQVADASNSAEGGKLTLSVASHDGETQPGLIVTDGSAEDEVDVTVGNGSASRTTISGDMTITTIANPGSDVDKFLVSNSGVVGFRTGAEVASDIGAVASDANITFTGKLTGSNGMLIPDDVFLTFGTDENVTIEYDEDGNDTLIINGAPVNMTADLTASNGMLIPDDTFLKFGTGGDVTFEYDEDGNDTLIITGAPVRVTADLTASNGMLIPDDTLLRFGTGADWTIEYDENGDDDLKMAGTTFTMTADTAVFKSANSTDPMVVIQNTTNDANSARLRFVKDKGAAGADNDVVGMIEFVGDDDAQDQVLFGRIAVQVVDASNGAEGGGLALSVATHDGELQNGLLLTDGSAEDEIDATIGNGAGSVTTVAGSLTVTHNVLIDSSPADESCSGITATFTAGEDLVRGEVVYFKAGDSKMWKAVATAAATSRCVAMAAEDISADAAGTFLMKGSLTDNGSFPSYTIGGVLYTPEAETSSENVPEQAAPDTDGDFVQIIGWAVTANTVYFCPDSTVIEVA